MNVDQEGAMEQSKGRKERRKFPRTVMDLPIEYRVRDVPHPHGGVVINGSETGLLIHSVKDIPVGTKLNIAVLFPAGFELSNFEVLAEIVRKQICWEEDWQGFEYGLAFIHIKEEDAQKLAQLLKKRFRWR
jgi:hypothetical protein